MAYFVTMRQTGRASDISCYKNLIITRNYTAAAPAVAGGTLCNSSCNFHKIFVPGRADVFLCIFIIFRHSKNIAHLIKKYKKNLLKKNLYIKIVCNISKNGAKI